MEVEEQLSISQLLGKSRASRVYSSFCYGRPEGKALETPFSKLKKSKKAKASTGGTKEGEASFLHNVCCQDG